MTEAIYSPEKKKKLELEDLKQLATILVEVLKKVPQTNDVLTPNLFYSSLSNEERLIFQTILNNSQLAAIEDSKKEAADSEERFENMQCALGAIINLFNRFPKLATCFDYNIPNFFSEAGVAYTDEQKKKLKEIVEAMQKLKVENTMARYQDLVGDKEFGNLKDPLISIEALFKKSPELSFFITIEFDYDDDFSGETGDQYTEQQKKELQQIINSLKEAKQNARINRIDDMNYTNEQFIKLVTSLNTVRKMLSDHSSDLSKFIRLFLPWENAGETYQLPYNDDQKILLVETIRF